ncbi:hypothetical protein HAV_00157 [Candidatus Hepatincola sp. Av]
MKKVVFRLSGISCKKEDINSGYSFNHYKKCGIKLDNTIIEGVAYPLFEYQYDPQNSEDIFTLYLRLNVHTFNSSNQEVRMNNIGRNDDYCIENYFNMLNEEEKNKEFHKALQSAMKDIVATLNEQYPNEVDTLYFYTNPQTLKGFDIELPEYLLNAEDCKFINKNSNLNISFNYYGGENYQDKIPAIHNLYYPVKSKSQKIEFAIISDSFYINISKIKIPNNYSSIQLVNLKYDKKYFEISKQENTEFNIKSDCKELIFEQCVFQQDVKLELNDKVEIKSACKELVFESCTFANHLTLSSNNEVDISIKNTDVTNINMELPKSNLSISNNQTTQENSHNCTIRGECNELSVKVIKITLKDVKINDINIGNKVKHISITNGKEIQNLNIYNPNIDTISINETKLTKLNIQYSKINFLRVDNSKIGECRIIGVSHNTEESNNNSKQIFSFNQTQIEDLIILSSHLEELEIYDSTITRYCILSRNHIYKQCSFVMVGFGNIFNFTVNNLDKFFINKIYFINPQNISQERQYPNDTNYLHKVYCNYYQQDIININTYFKHVTNDNIEDLVKLYNKIDHSDHIPPYYTWEENNILGNWRDSSAFIKAKLDANKNHIEANKFYQLEMLIQGRVLDSKLSSIYNTNDKWYVKLRKILTTRKTDGKYILLYNERADAILHWLDKWFSNHSQSTLRAIIAYVLVVLAGGLLSCGNFMAIAFPPYLPNGVPNNVWIGFIFLLFKPLSTYAIWQIIKSSRQNVRRS